MSLTLAYRAYGSGSPVLMLHGLFGSGMNWRSIAQRLAARHRVYTLDLRNHGDSPPADAMDYPAIAEDVRAFLDAHRLAPVAVLGHSMGGKAAMTLALSHPQRVERLIIVDVAPVAYPHDYDGILEALIRLDVATLQSRREADQRLARFITDPRLRGFLLHNLRQGANGWRWRINLAEIQANMEAITGFSSPPQGRVYPGKVLFIRGERSPYVATEYHGSIERLFPQAQIHTIEAAGHWLHAEKPTAFMATVQDFLAA